MTEHYDFEIVYKKDDGTPETLDDGSVKINHLKNIKEYTLVERMYWFFKLPGEMIEKEGNKPFGSYEQEYLWIPVEKIYSLKCNRVAVFSSHSDKGDFIRETLGGIKPKKRQN